MKKVLLFALLVALAFSVGCRRCQPRYNCDKGNCPVVTCKCGCEQGKVCTCPKCPVK